ncbi:MAG: hypothetical protein ACQEP2_08280 [Actinomycetota bacterium]
MNDTNRNVIEVKNLTKIFSGKIWFAIDYRKRYYYQPLDEINLKDWLKQSKL